MLDDAFYSRPTRIEVSTSALAANFSLLQAHVHPAEVIAVVKANAYGHGLIESAKAFIQAGAKRLGVAILEEGVALRRAGITTPILVFGGILGEQIGSFLDFDLEITASSSSKLLAIDETARARGIKAKVHIKIDTGMERIGTHFYSCEELLERAFTAKGCQVVGIFSHLARAEDSELDFTQLQLSRFLVASRYFCERYPTAVLRHIANSAAVLRMPESFLDAVRPGIALYGVMPNSDLTTPIPLRPALRLLSRIVFFKVVKKGAGVSYNHTWSADQNTRVVTIPIGYGDGYKRSLSNKASVLICNRLVPLCGNVCMDQVMANLGPTGEAYNGDEVVIIGVQGAEEIKVERLAELAGTIPHETLTSLNSRIPRVYV